MPIIHSYSNSEYFLLHLCGLLEEYRYHNTLVEQCIEELQTSEVLFHPGGELSTLHVYNTYAAREQLTPSTLQVYDSHYRKLVEALHEEPEPSVRFIAITTQSGTFLLFTNALITRIIGILPLGKTLAGVQIIADASPFGFPIAMPVKAASIPERYKRLYPQ